MRSSGGSLSSSSAAGSRGHSAAFASKSVAHETQLLPKQLASPGPGEYNLDAQDLASSSLYPNLNPHSIHQTASFASASPRASRVLEPAWLSGPLKTSTPHERRASAGAESRSMLFEGWNSVAAPSPSTPRAANAFAAAGSGAGAYGGAPPKSPRSATPKSPRFGEGRTSSAAFHASFGSSHQQPSASPGMPSPPLARPMPRSHSTPPSRPASTAASVAAASPFESGSERYGGGSAAASNNRGERSRARRESSPYSSRGTSEVRSMARLQEAEQRAAEAMARLAQVHQELNASQAVACAVSGEQ